MFTFRPLVRWRQSFWTPPPTKKKKEIEIITNTSMPFCVIFWYPIRVALSSLFPSYMIWLDSTSPLWKKCAATTHTGNEAGWMIKCNCFSPAIWYLFSLKLQARRNRRHRRLYVEAEEVAVAPATARPARKNTLPTSRAVTSARNAAAPTPLTM